MAEPLVKVRVLIAAVSIAAILVAASLLAVGIVVTGKNSTQVCRQVGVLRGSIYNLLQRSQTLLGKKGGAGYEYYRQHPAELVLAQQEITRELKAFSPLAC